MKLKCQSIRHSYIVQPLLFSVIKVTEKRREIVSRGNGLLQKTNILCRGQRSGDGCGQVCGYMYLSMQSGCGLYCRLHPLSQ